MTDALRLVLALVTGLLLGAIFFGGLWWTVRKGFSSKQPALWFFGSLLLRTSIALAGFYFIAVSYTHLDVYKRQACWCASLHLSWRELL